MPPASPAPSPSGNPEVHERPLKTGGHWWGGAEEHPRRGEWRRRALTRDQDSVGTAPSPDLWPPTTRWLGGAKRKRRGGGSQLWRGALLAALALGVSGCGTKIPPFPYSLNGPEFLLFYGLLTSVTLLLVRSAEDRLGEARAHLFGDR